MVDRIHITVEPTDKEKYREAARLEGRSLSEWLREAAEERWRRARSARSLDTVDELRAFFRRCDDMETGEEPDWDEHLRVIEESRAAGRSSS